MTNLPLYLAILLAYLFGSLSSAIIISKFMKLPDPRKQGSRNPGATNVLRLGGKKAAIWTLLGDILKGVIVVLAAKLYGFTPFELSLITFAVFLGHLFPLYFGFNGGKGVATAFGCFIALSWPTGLALIATWLIMAVIFRYSSLAALTAAVLAPLYIGFFTDNRDYTLMTLTMSIFLIYRHRLNIVKLLKGQESKIGAKAPPSTNVDKRG